MSKNYSIENYVKLGMSYDDAKAKVEENKRNTVIGIKTRAAKKRLINNGLDKHLSLEELITFEKECSVFIKAEKGLEILKYFVFEKGYNVEYAMNHILTCLRVVGSGENNKYKKLLKSKALISLLYGIESVEYKKLEQERKTKYRKSMSNFENFSSSYEDKDQALKDYKEKYGSLNIKNIMNKHNCNEEEALIIRKHRTNKIVASINEKDEMEKAEINRRKAPTLKNFIRKYGEFLGILKYNEYREVKKNKGNLEYYINMYGEKEGFEKFDKIKRITYITRDYWRDRGYNEDEITSILNRIFSERPSFSKQFCIEKYGYEKGIRVWKERQILWQKSLNQGKTAKEIEDINKRKGFTLENQIQKYGYEEGKRRYIESIDKRGQTSASNYISKQSNTFFLKLYRKLRKLGIIEKKKIYFGVKGSKERFIISKDDKKVYFYDFCIEELKIIIEYHGVIFHPRADREWIKIYPNMPDTKEEAFEREKRKENLAIKNGYDYHIVWSDSNLDEELERLTLLILEKKEKVDDECSEI